MDNKKVRLELKLSEDDKNKLKSRAYAKGMPVNKYVMELVEQDIKRGKTEQ